MYARECVQDAIKEYRYLNKTQKKDLIRDKIRSCLKPNITQSRYFHYNWTIGVAPKNVIRDVCIGAFMKAYDIKIWWTYQVIKEVKHGICNSDGVFNDRSAPARDEGMAKYRHLFSRLFLIFCPRAN